MDRRPRSLSHTEIQTALTCFARWDFQYGGRLAGSTLKPRSLAPVLSEGRAWGAAVAAWHQNSNGVLARWDAHTALQTSLDHDITEIESNGWPAPSAMAQQDTRERLSAMLDHYAETCEPLPALNRLEGALHASLPSRRSRRASPVYRFVGYVDADTTDSDGLWIVEFKLRYRLTDPRLVERQRQPRWYAWAYFAQTGRMPAGVIVDERLNQVPERPRLVQGRRAGQGRVPSHAKDQLITPESYLQVCDDFGVDPEPTTVETLENRMWQQRIYLPLRPDEIDAAGHELRDAAKLIRDLDAGVLTPIRNADQAHCNRCRFNAICTEPGDEILVDSLYTRSVPKRLRPTEEEDHDRRQPAAA
jgi:hypothetical protein